MSEPQTKAGRALLEASFSEEGLPLDFGAAILAIEREAVRAAFIHERQSNYGLHLYNESCVLCIIAEEEASHE